MIRRTMVIQTMAGMLCTSLALGQSNEQALIKTARERFELIRNGAADAFVATADERMQQALPAVKLQAVWATMLQQYGAFQGERRASVATIGPYTTVILTCDFAKGPLDVRMSFDDQGRTAGLYFTPNQSSSEYTTPPYVDPSQFTEKSVTVSATNSPIALPGTLTLPKGNARHAAVVLVHGSGPHDQDESIFSRRPFKDLAWGLASRGVAVLRYEKRTLKYAETMDPATITIDEETADDALSAARMLFHHERIKPDRVFIVGHSLGASAAPYIASREPRIAGVVLLAGAARPIYELVAEQIPYLANTDGVIDDTERVSIEQTLAVVEKLRTSTWKSGETLLGAPVEYWASLDRMAPVKHAKALQRPMLIIQGGRDYQVPDTDFEIWNRELQGRANVTFKRFADLDHLLAAGSGPSTPKQYEKPGHIDGRVVELIAGWINR